MKRTIGKTFFECSLLYPVESNRVRIVCTQILWDSNAPMADYPVAHHVMQVSEESSAPQKKRRSAQAQHVIPRNRQLVGVLVE